MLSLMKCLSDIITGYKNTSIKLKPYTGTNLNVKLQNANSIVF